jgi:beta-mannosidase
MASSTTLADTAGAFSSVARPLQGTALIKDFTPGAGSTAGAAGPGHDTSDWMAAPIASDVYRALVASGRLPEPFYDRNEDACGWVAEREWWYRFSLDAPATVAPEERVRLVFGGLDTLATVYLNGEEIARHQNMFAALTIDVTDRLALHTDNVVAVRFDPRRPSAGFDEYWAAYDHGRVWQRKAQFGYGWDWGPRLPTVGIWRGVKLRHERCATLAGVHFATLRLNPDHTDALVEVRVEAQRFHFAGRLEADVELRSPDGADAWRSSVSLDDGAGSTVLALRDPQLWWTHDLGQPALHELTVRLLADGAEVESRRERVGVRTVELDQRPDPEEPGTRFFSFVLNGVALFARGANWIPLDSFVASIPEERYVQRLEDARAANMNMLRVWGGGIYEHESFYELCDRHGLLVWQDFMFACAAYPEGELADEVEREARYQVDRLRNHPCLALWCGNNECQWLHDLRHPEGGGERVPGSLFYDEVLPRVVAELDGVTPYWPGSPYGGSDHNAREQGDVHNWDVWHGSYPRRFGEPARREPTPESVSFRRYAEDMGRFISEFGVLSAPSRETLRRWIPPDQLFHHSPSLDHHTKDTPKDKVDMLLESVTGLAVDIDEFVDFSMIAQAEALKFGIEHYRRRKPHCAGALVWQLNDCWPGPSWSIVDYHGFQKGAYFFLRRAFAPIIASFRTQPDGRLELWLVNDTPSPVADAVRVAAGRFADGATVLSELPVEVAAHASVRVASWSADEIPGDPDCYLTVRSAGDTFPANRHFFAAVKDLRRERPRVTIATERVSDERLRVRLRADVYAYFVALSARDERVRYSDNFIELEAGEERVIDVDHPDAAPRAEDLELRWR